MICRNVGAYARGRSAVRSRSSGARIVAPDRVQDASPRRPQAAVDHLAQLPVAAGADVLHHAHGSEDVELAANRAVVVLDEFDAVFQPFRLGPLPGVADLLVRDVIGLYLAP